MPSALAVASSAVTDPENQAEAQQSGFRLERRSKGARAGSAGERKRSGADFAMMQDSRSAMEIREATTEEERRLTSMKRAVLPLLCVLLLALSACTGSFEPPISFDPPYPSESQASQAENPAVETMDPAEVITPDADGYAMGYLGDTLRTDFFDMRVDSAYTCYEFDGVAPQEGYKLLVAQVTLYNYTNFTQPMFNTDFEVWWDAQEGESSDDAWDFPLTRAEELEDGSYEYYNLSDQQLPVEWDFPIHETQSGILLYQVPEGSSTFSVAFLEYYNDGTTGDLYEVRFSAPLAQ